MATNLSIDSDLIERALQVSGERSKRATVTKALQEFIARRRQKRLLDLMGKLEWDSAYDHKASAAAIEPVCRAMIQKRRHCRARPGNPCRGDAF